MDSTVALVALIVIIALTFDSTNGFHDAANSIATVVSTRVLSPVRAVILAAFFNRTSCHSKIHRLCWRPCFTVSRKPNVHPKISRSEYEDRLVAASICLGA